MLILALAISAPLTLTETHQSDIACVVEIAVLAEGQRRGVASGPDIQASGKRWAGIVGERIMLETGQPRELISFAMTEAAKARAARGNIGDTSACMSKMTADLAVANSANAPLPKPVKAQ